MTEGEKVTATEVMEEMRKREAGCEERETIDKRFDGVGGRFGGINRGFDKTEDSNSWGIASICALILMMFFGVDDDDDF